MRKTNYRKVQIEKRLEILEGYLIAYIKLDKVIHIIREHDDSKNMLMSKFKLTDIQADAILNMRLRSLRKLEEFEIKEEHKRLSEELANLKLLLNNKDSRWNFISDEIKQTKKEYGDKNEIGNRRTIIDENPVDIDIPLESMIEKEPITIVCSKNGWVRGLKGHVSDKTEIKYKEGDKEGFVLKAQTTDKLLVMSSSGKVYTLGCDKLPSGRGNGEPLNLLIDYGSESIVNMRIFREEGKLIVASTDGRGFIINENNIVAQTKNGKQILSVSGNVKAYIMKPADGDKIAVVGTNRKLLIFGIDELPEMSRGRGVQLQKYRDAKLVDLKVFNSQDGLSWASGKNRIRKEEDITTWIGKRASVGKMPPVGFPRNNKFD